MCRGLGGSPFLAKPNLAVRRKGRENKACSLRHTNRHKHTFTTHMHTHPHTHTPNTHIDTDTQSLYGTC